MSRTTTIEIYTKPLSLGASVQAPTVMSYRWRFRAANHQIIAESASGYVSYKGVRTAVDKTVAAAGGSVRGQGEARSSQIVIKAVYTLIEAC